jgi:hypothetical protein
MRLAAGLVQLQEDFRALGADSVDDGFPAGSLAVVIQPGGAQVAVAVFGGDGGFGDQQAALRRALLRDSAISGPGMAPVSARVRVNGARTTRCESSYGPTLTAEFNLDMLYRL